MKALCLTGWQQRHDALSGVMSDALHLDYSDCGHIDGIYDKLGGQMEFDLAIGWSLGGQILLRAMDAGVIRAKRLVCISTAWQLVQSKDMFDATPPEIFQETMQNYKKNPEATIDAFQALVLMGDAQQKQLAREHLGEPPPVWPQGLAWLKTLRDFSCSKLRWHDLPEKITFIHGDADVIAPVTQMEYFRQAIPSAEIFIIEGCAHAPHWHDAEAVRDIIG